MYKPNRENWVVEIPVDVLIDGLEHKKAYSPREEREIKLWREFLIFMESDRKLFLQYDDYVFFFGE
jgi:hypothetical protein